MRTLREVLQDVGANGRAVGHFNVSESSAFRAIADAARLLRVPVMIGVSEGECGFIGARSVAAIVKSYREEYGMEIYLNADHTHSLEKIEEAARAGFDEVLFDGARLPLEENIKQTKAAVLLAKSINPDIIVEGELGYIGASSEILDDTPEGAEISENSITTAKDAVRFVRETGIDVLAPAVGNMHGMLVAMIKRELRKRLFIKRIEEIKQACGIFLTLHGGSGTADEDFAAAIKAGMTIIHVNTELRLAWRRGLEKKLLADPKEVAPYKLLALSVENMKEIVRARLSLFNGQHTK